MIDFTVPSSGVFMSRTASPGVRYLRISSTTTRLSRRSRRGEPQDSDDHASRPVQLRADRDVEGTIDWFTAIKTGRHSSRPDRTDSRIVFDAGRIRYTFLIDTLGDADLDNDVFLVNGRDSEVAGPIQSSRRFRLLRLIRDPCLSANPDRRGETRLVGRISERPPRCDSPGQSRVDAALDADEMLPRNPCLLVRAVILPVAILGEG